MFDWILIMLFIFSVFYCFYLSERMLVFWSLVLFVVDFWFFVVGMMFCFIVWDGVDVIGFILRCGVGRGRRCVYMYVMWGCEGVYIKMD